MIVLAYNFSCYVIASAYSLLLKSYSIYTLQLFILIIFAPNFQKRTMIKSNKKLAIDFDGTIVDDAYPGIGKPKIFVKSKIESFKSSKSPIPSAVAKTKDKDIPTIIIIEYTNSMRHQPAFGNSK